MLEHEFLCPYCNALISMALDPTADQRYIEDCEVCCNPIQVAYAVIDGSLTFFQAESIEQ